MKKILFIGAADKSDLLLSICKVLASSGSRVLLVDGTVGKKLRYSINHFKDDQAVIEFEGFDVSLSFGNISEVEGYLNEQDQNEQYDTLIVDTDANDFLTYADYKNANMRIIVTSYEKYCMDQNEVIISSIYSTDDKPGQVEVDRIIVNSVECGIDEDYLNMQLANYYIIWPEESFYLPFDEVNYAIKIRNQHNKRINFKRVSRAYLSVIGEISQKILDCDKKTVKTAIKLAQRRG